MNSALNISLEDVPLLCEGVDIKSLNISQEEGFLLSRIDGQMRVRHLIMITGLGKEQTLKIIQGLVDEKIIILHEHKPKPEDKAAKKETAQPGVRVVINVNAVPTGKDFEEFVARLLAVLDRTDYYSLLGVKMTASLPEIKRAYRRLAKIFHPDRHFGKVTPEFRSNLQQVFKSINIAYQVLSEDERRAAYAAELAAKGVEGAGEELRLEIAKKIYTGPKFKLGLNEDKQKAKDEKLKRMFANVKNSPRTEHMAKIERLYQGAMVEIDKKHFNSARMNLKLAIQMDPTSGKKYKAELDRIDQIEQGNTVESSYQEGRAAEKSGEYSKASKFYGQALKAAPDDKRFIASQARIMVKYTSNFERGRGLLLKLVELDNKNPEYFYLLGLAYLGLGQKRAAEVQFQKVLEMDPKHREASKQLKALK